MLVECVALSHADHRKDEKIYPWQNVRSFY